MTTPHQRDAAPGTAIVRSPEPVPSVGDSVTILNRRKPCNCGCGGTDPWHRRRFTRCLKQVRAWVGTARTRAWGTCNVDAIGWVHLPAGGETVVRVRHEARNFVWHEWCRLDYSPTSEG